MEELLKSAKMIGLYQRNGISFLGLFGSVARSQESAVSDLDLLVRFNRPIGYFGLVHLQRLFENNLGRKVDLVTEGSLSPDIKPYVQADLKTIYGNQRQ